MHTRGTCRGEWRHLVTTVDVIIGLELISSHCYYLSATTSLCPSMSTATYSCLTFFTMTASNSRDQRTYHKDVKIIRLITAWYTSNACVDKHQEKQSRMKQNDTNLVEHENELLLVKQDKVLQH